MNTIALPSREIWRGSILPTTLELPRFLRHLKDAKDEHVSRMFSGAFRRPFQKAFVTPDALVSSNPLASVSWVAQWKFNNDGQDSIGTNHLTAVNAPTFTTGKLGGATGATQLVAASSQYWSIADNAALSMADIDFTVCFWLYLTTIGSVQRPLGKWYTTGDQRQFLFYFNFDSLIFFVSPDGLNNTNIANPTTLSSATWYCVVAWHDSAANTINLQINDGTVASTAHTTGVFNGTGDFTIGQAAATEFLNGRMDNVCIAKSAAGGGGVLSAIQRTAFYNAGAGTETLT